MTVVRIFIASLTSYQTQQQLQQAEYEFHQEPALKGLVRHMRPTSRPFHGCFDSLCGKSFTLPAVQRSSVVCAVTLRWMFCHETPEVGSCKTCAFELSGRASPQKCFISSNFGWIMRLDEDDRLRTRNLKSTSAAHVPACQHIIDSHHVIPRLLKAGPIHLICALGRLRFLGPFKPAHIVFTTFSTVRTAISRLLYFFFLVKKVSFVHNHHSVSITKFS